MVRSIEITSLGIFTQMNACAHSCSYCCMANKRLVKLSRDRFTKLITRFENWRDASKPGFRIAVANQYSFDEGLDSPRSGETIMARAKGKGRIHLGGLKMRPDHAARAWIRDRFDQGIGFANASYAGVFEVHDRWNRRQGDFQHLLRLQTFAAEVGMDLGQYLFVARSTFQHLEALLDHLESLPRQATERFLIPFGYVGWAREHEDERIMEEHREKLSDRLRRLLRNADDWKSEREWMAVEPNDELRSDVMMRLDVDETNIERLEATSCQDIFDDLETRTRTAYRTLPGWDELRDQYGDRAGRRIYASRDDIERKWFDAHQQDYAAQFDRQLTHLRGYF